MECLKLESFPNQISLQEEEIKLSYHRIETIERALRLRELTPEERTTFEQEINILKDSLKVNEENLKSLRKENHITGVLVTALIFVCFLVYGLYVMFWK